ncbi:MAG: hydrogenase iron-sulfur subunit [Desulfomonilia bacterium]
MAQYSPKVVCFSCKFGWGYLQGNGGIKSIQNLIPVTCSGSVSAQNIIDAFRKGADGVLVLGCPDGECHFQNGNYQTRKRILLIRKTLKDFGIEPERLKFKLDIDPEGKKIKGYLQEMEKEIKRLGPLSPTV